MLILVTRGASPSDSDNAISLDMAGSAAIFPDRMRVSVLFRPSEQAPERAAAVRTILAADGHQVETHRLPLLGGLLPVLRARPDAIHACGPAVFTAYLVARLSGASLVYEPLAASSAGSRGLHRRASVRLLARRAVVIAAGGDAARRIRSELRLPFLPPAVGDLEDGAPHRDPILLAVYDRLPRLSPALASSKRRMVWQRPLRLLSEAGRTMRRASLRHPRALAAILRGRRLQASGRIREAADALRRALERDPANATVRLQLAASLAQAGMREEASEELRIITATAEPLAASLLGQAAQVHAALGEVGAAAEIASRAAETRPRSREAARMIALALESAGEPTQALKVAERSSLTDQRHRLSGLLRSLDPSWMPRLPPARGGKCVADGEALCLLETSLLHAPSGYAYRSRDLLAALRGVAIEPLAATRLGFPASRGISDWSPVESVDGVIHHRFNLPGFSQYSGIPLNLLLEANAACLLGLIERRKPALTLAATPHLNGVLALSLRSATGTPVVYDVRGFPEMTWARQPGGSERELYRLRRAAETRCAVEADAVITLSETMREELAKRGVDSAKIAVVPHVVDPERYSPRPAEVALERSYGIEGRLVVGCISTLRRYEGIDVLLRALALARQREPDLAALIVGDGPARISLESQALDLGLSDCAIFTGRLPHSRVPEHYALLDLFAIPRRDLEVCRKVTPLKLFEALAMGLPIIASDLPVLAEPVTASEGGRLVPPDSPEPLAEALIELASDGREREALGARAREYAVAHHNPGEASDALRSALAPLLS
jgi:glycosyltransferase involved in cell wall biosynthesis